MFKLTKYIVSNNTSAVYPDVTIAVKVSLTTP